jgi:hypothetical protein
MMHLFAAVHARRADLSAINRAHVVLLPKADGLLAPGSLPKADGLQSSDVSFAGSGWALG